MPANNTERVQRSIQIYAIIAIVLIAIIITGVATYPLYSKLRDTEQRDLIFARDTSVLIVNEYISRIKDIAKQISSRTKASLLVQEYESGKITKVEMETYLNKILGAALKSSAQLIGITRINQKGEVMTSVGKPFFKEFWSPDINSSQLKIYGPLVRDGHYYLSIVSPILTPEHKKIGYDLILFDITDLQSSIHQKMQYRLGEILIAYIKNDRLNIFSPIDTPWKKLLNTDNVLVKSLATAIDHKEQGLMSGKVGNNNVFIAYAPIHQSNWGIAVIIKKNALFASIQKILWVILAVIIFVTLFFIIGLGLCLKPLSGRIIMRHQELKEEVKKGKSELEKANNNLQHLADHDFLTGIINRRGFNDALEREISRSKRYKKSFGILYIDINEFKKINDEKGHKAGDILLKTFAECLRLSVRKEDTVARLGGDEFAVILPNLIQEKLDATIKKIREIALLPITYNSKALVYSISIGSALYPKDGNNIDELLNHADQNMYDEKKYNE